MPVINDFPTTIYVRDIEEAQGEAFSKIKKKFGLSSNNEVVKTLFVKYLELEAERNELKIISTELINDKKKQQHKFDLLKETFLMLKNL